MLRGTAVGAVGLVAVLVAGPAYAAPKQDSSPVAGLVNQIADVDQNLSQLSQLVAAKRENVNRTLVDFQNAVAAQQVAAAADDAAQASLKQTREQVDVAQRAFDEFMRSVNRQGNNMGSMTKYVASDDPDKVLEQMTAVEQTGRQQRATIEKLRIIRNQQANRVAATAATRRQTDLAAQTATARRQDALAAAQQAQQAVTAQQSQRDSLVKQRAELTEKLAQAKGEKKASGPVTGKDLADAVKNLPTNKAADDDVAGQAGGAVADVALQATSQLLEGLLGNITLPNSELLNELGIGGSAPLSTGPNGTISRIGTGSLGSLIGGGVGGGAVRPGLRGPQAVEMVVNRAKSVLGTPYAWGGGDANGPTLGIRDGGVADMHGDYNKIGFDCSGLMIYAFAAVGIELPHYTGYQYTSGPHVPLAEMQRGDMIFYGPNAGTHVAMILGDGTMIEAPESGDVVKISPVRTDGAMPYVVRLL
ncbi:MAG: NlpC/P60 family protein [Gordonia sp. (in: high G+C Gram-positive bacteria)]|uniref:NlpC/P60 family protein n=1 Tax=Gordonia sp. (in: high G+C Gram-positive bacteria) TaxID=84139 RepID=UPI0039E63EA7